MPSPFPGMDPFVEAPGYFESIHSSLITYLREALQPLLPEPYYTDSDDRTWIEASKRDVVPDVSVLREERLTQQRGGASRWRRRRRPNLSSSRCLTWSSAKRTST